jgi:hypothetical protein
MATWPNQSDYKDALQNPDIAFRDPDLKQSQAERSPMGVPRARSGAFASVYKMTGPRGPIALKLFNFPNEDRALRYKAVSDYLEKKLGAKKPPCVVKFQYHLEGIRVGKGWYPTLTMTWVKGVSLGEWVRQTVEKKNPDVAAMRKMSELWTRLVRGLQAARIAHGDLQHDNVMVVNDAPMLVDYDGMCVPALDPAEPAQKLEQLEFGKPAYQHPARPAEKLGGALDNFSAWVVLIALRATAADPQLYVKYVLKTDNENLLFTPEDMTAPEKSRLWPELGKSPDADVRKWSGWLREALSESFDRIPWFRPDNPDKVFSEPEPSEIEFTPDPPLPDPEPEPEPEPPEWLEPTPEPDPRLLLERYCNEGNWAAADALAATFSLNEIPDHLRWLVALAWLYTRPQPTGEADDRRFVRLWRTFRLHTAPDHLEPQFRERADSAIERCLLLNDFVSYVQWVTQGKVVEPDKFKRIDAFPAGYVSQTLDRAHRAAAWVNLCHDVWEALEDENTQRAVELIGEGRSDAFPWPRDIASRVAELVATLPLSPLAQRIRDAVVRGDLAALNHPQRLACVRDNPAWFSDLRSALENPPNGVWLIGGTSPEGLTSRVRPDGLLEVAWRWPEGGVRECVVIASDGRIRSPHADGVAFRATADVSRFGNGNPVLVAPVDLKRLNWVTVWALVDLDWVSVPGGWGRTGTGRCPEQRP